MAWALKATWEWIAVDKDEADWLKWKECSTMTCLSLQEAIDSDHPVGKKVTFVDHGVHRKVTVTQVDGNRMVLQVGNKHSWAPMDIIVRPVVRKLLHCRHENGNIMLTGVVSGGVALTLPLESYRKESWGSFSRIVEEELNLRHGRVILFPPGYDSAETMEEWKLHPRNRIYVENLLKVVDGPEKSERKVRYVRK